MSIDILVVDDEADIRELVSGILSDEGYDVRTAADGESALVAIRDRKPALVILDVWMQGGGRDGLDVLDVIQSIDPTLPVVMISGHGTVETAVGAIKRGAYDYIEKPFTSERLTLIAARALEAAKLKRENQELRARTDNHVDMTGRSAAIATVRNLIAKAAPANSRILISGPAGSGKEVTARLIHDKSHRAQSPFVALNAAAITPERMEIELFGEEDEAGRTRRIGAFEEAHGGTLYLDEVGDMPHETQAKILRVLVDQRFHRVGGATDVRVDVRVMSSTTKDSRAEIAAGRFREDLYHRLAVVPIRMPALSERREDIPDLIMHFIARVSEQSGLNKRTLSDDAMAALQAYDWPGNVRQVKNIVERLLILAPDNQDEPIGLEDLPAEITGANPVSSLGFDHLICLSLRDAREVFERDYLVAQISRFSGNISRTAAFIGMERSALHRKMKSLGLGTREREDELDPV